VSAVGSRRTSCATPTPSSLAREGVPLNIIQRQLGHANLGTTSIYLQGIDPEEIIAAVTRPSCADDVCQRRAAPLNAASSAGAPPALPLRHV
jgi:hypothetical protein